ncbi:uncharacterized protein METZ01_LOCUS303044, partial [marine metagenome]
GAQCFSIKENVLFEASFCAISLYR